MSTWQRRSGIMLAYPYDQERLTGSKSGRKTQWQKPWLCQPKYNGERVRAEVFKGHSCLWSSEENVITSLPHINKFLESLNFPFDVQFDSEGYCHGMSRQAIGSRISRSKNLHHDHETIQLHIFDLITDAPQMQRIDWMYKLKEFIGPNKFLEFAPTNKCTEISEIEVLLHHYINQGYEGLILREPGETYHEKRVTSMMKWKPRKSDSYLIIGYSEEISKDGEPKNALGSLVCKDDHGETFSVGTGTYLDRFKRNLLWTKKETLPGLWASIKYPELTERGIPDHPVIFDITNNRIDYDEEEN